MKKPVKPSPIGSKPKEPEKPDEFKSIVVFRTPTWTEEYEDYEAEDDAGKIALLLDEWDIKDGVATNEWDRTIKVEGASLEEVYEFVYWPSGSSHVSVADIIAKHPDVPLDELYICAEAWRHRGSTDSDVELEVSYPVRRPEYDEELAAYEKQLKKHAAALRAHKKAAKQHKENLAKYRKDLKKYNEWRANRIEELEAAGEL